MKVNKKFLEEAIRLAKYWALKGIEMPDMLYSQRLTNEQPDKEEDVPVSRQDNDPS